MKFRDLIAGGFHHIFMAVAVWAIAGQSGAEPIESRKIITALTADFNGNSAQDLVLILETQPGDPMDMHFFLRDKKHDYLKPVEVVHEQIEGEWNGYDRPGYEASDTEPQLTALANGSILLEIPAMPIGRRRVDQTLTIAYRQGQFVVAGFAYEVHDYQEDTVTEDDALRARCDYNLLTGRGHGMLRDKQNRLVEKTVAVKGQIVAFRDWQYSVSAEACGVE